MNVNHGLYEGLLSAMEVESGVSRSVLASVMVRVIVSAPADIARADIASSKLWRLPLNASAVSKAVRVLVNEKLLAEDPPTSDENRAGRPIKPLRLSTERWGLMGMKVIHRNDKPIRLAGVITSLGGDTLTDPKLEWPLPDDADFHSGSAVADQVKKFHDYLLEQLTPRPQLLGIGVEVASHVHEGQIVGATHVGISSDEATDLLTPLQQRLETPIIIDNDVNVLAVSETYRRNYEEQDITVVAVLNDGVGASLIIDGQVYRGGGGLAAEPGHLTVTVARSNSQQTDDGRPGFDDPCHCMKMKHVDCYSTPARLAAELGVQDITEAAHLPAHDDSGQLSFAATVFGTGGEALGQAIASIINIVNPSRVILRLPSVLGAPAARTAPEQYLSEMEKAVTEYSFSRGAENARAGQGHITVDTLDPEEANREGARCAAIRALDEFIRHARGRDHCTRPRFHRRVISAA